MLQPRVISLRLSLSAPLLTVTNSEIDSCRKMGMTDNRIIGELLQPGGLRALERMGLADAATRAATDSVVVDG
jgi:hypothetical protein